MRTNGGNQARRAETARTDGELRLVTWQADDISLPIGVVRASGAASPQVRSPQRLAEVGDVDAQVEHVRRAIADALAGVLVGMEPTVDDLVTRRDEIASLTLVAANRKLGAMGVSLLELRIETLNVVDG